MLSVSLSRVGVVRRGILWDAIGGKLSGLFDL